MSLLIVAILFMLAFRWVVYLNRHAQTDASEAEPFDRCSGCGYDTRASPERCPECNAITPQGRRRRLQEEWPAAPIDPRHPDPHEPWVLVRRVEHPWEAALLKDHLEARGIACRLDGGSDTRGLAGSYMPVRSVANLTVPIGDSEQARSVLARLTGDDDPGAGTSNER